jgi:ribosomal protein S21
MTNIIDCKQLQKNYGSEAGLGVTSRPNETIESLLRRFKGKVKSSEVLEIYKEKRYYNKKSVVKRKKRLKSIKDQRKKSNEDKKFLDFK